MSRLIWYHGGPKLTYLGSIKWDRPRGERDQNAAGPGMYWTLSEREAAGYGTHLYRATTKPGFRMMPATRPTPTFVQKLFAAAGPARQRDFMDDWPDMTPSAVLQNYLREQTTIDAAVVLFHDLFRYNADDYVAAIRTIYDGVRIMGAGGAHNTADANGQHLVVWSPEKLTIDEAR